MELRAFELVPGGPRLRALVADTQGERSVELPGEALRGVAAEAGPLVAALAARAPSPVRAVSVDLVARVLRASLDGDAAPLALVGADFDGLAPLLGPVARAIGAAVRPRRPLPDGSPSEVAFWSRLYRAGRDGWELGRPAPPLARWFAAHPPTGRRALVAGCGRGHEARLLARAGAQVTAIDFADEALEQARALAAHDGVAIEFRKLDLFRLVEEPPRFDLAVEHCCLCAIDPARRGEYALAIAAALVPGGELVGLFFCHGKPGGPPFSAGRDELCALFAPRFDLLHDEVPRDSTGLRDGQELLLHLRRR